MAKFLALFLIATAALTTAQCPPNTRLCGSDILDNLKCKPHPPSSLSPIHPSTHPAQQPTPIPFQPTPLRIPSNNQPTKLTNQLTNTGGDDSITLITPKGNDPRNCNFFTNSEGTPQARGACCCAEGRCVTGTCD
jgi:hypothetical protein